MFFLRALLQIYSYVFHLMLGLFLLATSGLALFGAGQTLKLEVLPWAGDTLARVVFWSSLAGLTTLVLAVAGRLRFLFFFWTLIVLTLLVRGFFFSAYDFRGPVEFTTAMYLTLAALVAALGGFFQIRKREKRRKRLG